MAENKNKIWLDIGFGLALFLGVGLNIGLVFGQSSSPSYKAVDFINSEASQSSSSSYKLNDSIDYYGGVHKSASYNECTGDYAVMGNCGATVTPPPPPPPPPPTPNPTPTPTSSGTGGAGTTSTVLDCSKTLGGCTQENPTEPVPEKKPFKVPDITEPVAPTVAEKPITRPTVTQVTPSHQIIVEKPVQPEPGQVMVAVTQNPVVPEKGAAPEALCEELTCTQTAVIRPAAEEKGQKQQYPAACTIYVYGGFEVGSPCDVTVFVWLMVVLSSLYVLPVKLFVLARREISIIKSVRGMRKTIRRRK